MPRQTQVAIRVDASSEIGTGHFMRCLTLANALQRRNAAVCFVCRHLPQYLQHVLTDQGHKLYLLRAARAARGARPSSGLFHSSWLGVSQQVDAAETTKALADRTWDWIVVDHYAIDVVWEKLIRKITKNILAIDDIADRQHDCDVLLDQNFYEDIFSRYTDKVPSRCVLLLGPRYALLRDEFGSLHNTIRPRDAGVKRILIFFGGIDLDNLTTRALEALESIDCAILNVDVVLGAQHIAMASITSICEEKKYSLHVQTNQMAQLMASADLSIGASGSATWERCCMGLPAITISVASNQTEIAEGLERSGGGIFLGFKDSVTVNDIRDTVLSLLKSSQDIARLSSAALALVDGLGVERCLEAMGA